MPSHPTSRTRSPHHPITVVAGLQFGDEGKGQVVDALAAEHDVIVRVNGGANAGHSVRVAGERFALHLVPSGILRPTTLNVLANGVAIDPDVLLEEVDGLRQRGIEMDGRLVLSHAAHVVMPWHTVEDRLRDRASGLGTTGRGIGPAYADKALRDCAIRVCDLLDPGTLSRRVPEIVAVKNATLGALAGHVGEAFEPFGAAAIGDRCAAWGEVLRPFVVDTSELLFDALDDGRRVLVEGAHAAGLDVEQGTYPYVTSSVCLPNGVAAGAGLPDGCLGRVVGVVKAYTSRVGAGPFPTESHGTDADWLRERGREYGTTTGRPRRVGGLDVPAIARLARVGGVTEVALTGLGVLFDDPLREGAETIQQIETCIAPVTYVAVGPARDELLSRASDGSTCTLGATINTVQNESDS
ncbi:MAG: adenylosuccinate synthase [Acidimicrobiaceae bacterium]|jgi:adenylosuccinate synthase